MSRGWILGFFLGWLGGMAVWAQPQVTGFMLVNAEADTEVRALTDGETLDLNALGFPITLLARTDPPQTGSVRFTVNGRSVRTENSYPYAIAGDFPLGDYNPWQVSEGQYEICAIPYSEAGAKGIKGQELCIILHITKGKAPLVTVPEYNEIDFWGERISIPIIGSNPGGGSLLWSASGLPPSLTINEQSGVVTGILALANDFGSSTGFDAVITATNGDGLSASVPLNFFILHPSVESFTLINATTNYPVPGYDPVPENALLDVSFLGTELTFRANLSIPVVNGGAVLFTFDERFVRAENVAPYALGGDFPVGQYNGFPLPQGEHVLKAKIVSGVNGSGGFSFYGDTTLSFRVIDGGAAARGPEVAVYPNPATQFIYIREVTPQTNYEIVNLNGIRSLEGKTSTGVVDVSTLTSGMYVLRWQVGNGWQESRLVKW